HRSAGFGAHRSQLMTRGRAVAAWIAAAAAVASVVSISSTSATTMLTTAQIAPHAPTSTSAVLVYIPGHGFQLATLDTGGSVTINAATPTAPVISASGAT